MPDERVHGGRGAMESELSLDERPAGQAYAVMVLLRQCRALDLRDPVLDFSDLQWIWSIVRSHVLASRR